MPRAAHYPPNAPYAGGNGRFDDGVRLTLYLGASVAAAVAEFYRRHPEFLPAQDLAPIRAFEITMAVQDRTLDVRDSAKATKAGIEYARLTSNDADEDVRYVECRALAAEVDGHGTGIDYPSAAWKAGGTCLVLFNDTSSTTWQVQSVTEVPVPNVDPAQVVVVP